MNTKSWHRYQLTNQPLVPLPTSLRTACMICLHQLVQTRTRWIFGISKQPCFVYSLFNYLVSINQIVYGVTARGTTEVHLTKKALHTALTTLQSMLLVCLIPLDTIQQLQLLPDKCLELHEPLRELLLPGRDTSNISEEDVLDIYTPEPPTKLEWWEDEFLPTVAAAF